MNKSHVADSQGNLFGDDEAVRPVTEIMRSVAEAMPWHVEHTQSRFMIVLVTMLRYSAGSTRMGKTAVDNLKLDNHELLKLLAGCKGKFANPETIHRSMRKLFEQNPRLDKSKQLKKQK